MIRQPLLSPIRFHDPSLEFDNETTFQNPDNRLSTDYDWENVNEVPYALPIPKAWPDGQPGIDIMINDEAASSGATFYAKLYDEDDEEYKDLYVNYWATITSGSLYQHRVWLDGLSGTGIEDGYYTIKLFQTSDDSLLLESESLLIADWFIDCIPFEFWNFENDFGMKWHRTEITYTSRVMVPIRLFDPAPQFEKKMYKNDPGIETTLRASAQRIFNFDSHPLPVHVTELVQNGFVCSKLYLDRIQINAEENPEAELYKGTNLKYLTGKATFVDFNTNYQRESVQTEQTDQELIWDSTTYTGLEISYSPDNKTVNIILNPVVSTFELVQTDDFTVVDCDMILVKLTLIDNGTSDMPLVKVLGDSFYPKEWGVVYASYRVTADYAENFVTLLNFAGDNADFSAKVEVFKIT